MPNYIQQQSSVTDKLTTSITTYAQIERDAEKIAKHTLKRLHEVTPFNKEDIPNLGEHYIPIRVGEIKNQDTLGHYCRTSDTNIIEKDGQVVQGYEIVLSLSRLENRTAEQFFDLVSHETCHAWSGLLQNSFIKRGNKLASNPKSDCNKAGGHRNRKTNGDYSFEAIAESTGWHKIVELPSYVKLTTEPTEETTKQVKKLKISAPNMSKSKKVKKSKANKLSLICEMCEAEGMGFTVNAPRARFERGEIPAGCMIHDTHLIEK